VDSVQPGDRVAVTGVYRAVSQRSNPKMRNILSVYKTHIDVVHFRKTDQNRLHTCDSVSSLSEETVKMLEELSKKPDIYERLARAVAPSIYENEDVKKGILLQLFGGNRKYFSKTGRANFRSELNILLCGDPGTSKSQLLQYVYNLIPSSPANPLSVGPRGGPGSVRVSEIDLSSPLNYGTPSPGSSIRTPRTGSKGTPVRVRSDIQTDRRVRQVMDPTRAGGDMDIPSSSEVGVPPSEVGSDIQNSVVIWGTDVSINQCKSKMMKFVQTYINPDAADDETFAEYNPDMPYYTET
jgi:hypothetical protein